MARHPSGPIRKQAAGLQNISPKAWCAIVLMTMMVMLWGRVLLGGKGGPAAAQAQEMTEQQTPAQTAAASPVRVEQVVLPFEPGRHDRLAGDIFSADGWTAFAFHGTPKTAEPAGTGEDQRLQVLAEGLRKSVQLEAVIQGADGTPGSAFINGKVLQSGRTLEVLHGGQTYALRIEHITEKGVLLRWDDVSIELTITESQER